MLLLITNLCYGQSENTFDIKRMAPSSPEAAMIGRFGDIPIGFYTGTVDISVPIYTIKEAGLEIPVVLRYHSSGIKVEDHASNVGLGWNLEAEGSIIVIINGKRDSPNWDPIADRDPTGYRFMKSQGINSSYYERGSKGTWGCLGVYSDDDSSVIFDHLAAGEGQPDIYQYNFAGYSGKFAIDPETHKIVLLDKSRDITFTGSGDSWIAKTMDGNTFYFGNVEKSQIIDQPSSITIKLTSISLNNGKTINFTYQDGFYVSPMYNETYHTDYPYQHGSDNSRLVKTTDMYNHYVKTLTKITTDQVLINFNLEDRIDEDSRNTDGLTPLKRIKSIDIINATNGITKKSYDFSYGYFTSDGIIGGNYLYERFGNYYDNYISKRLKLLSVQEIGYSDSGPKTTKPPYLFSYNETIPLPLKTSFARDFWGYYNGVNNGMMIPNLSFYYMSGNINYTDVPKTLMSSLNGANRSADSTKIQAGMLKRITYPTGGFTEFDFEPHKFGNYNYPDLKAIPNISTYANPKDDNNTNNQTSYTFTLPHAQYITFQNSITRGPNTAMSYYQLSPAKITLSRTIAGSTVIMNTWQMDAGRDQPTFNSTGGRNWTDAIYFEYIQGAQYTVSCYFPDELGQQGVMMPKYGICQSSFNYESSNLNNNFAGSYGGGLRVKAIKNYNKSGEITGKKIINYLLEDKRTSGKLMSPLQSLYKRIVYGGITTPALLVSSVNVWFISAESQIPFSASASGSIVGYSRVEEKDIAPDGSVNGSHIYYYNNIESDAHANVPDNPNLLNGKIAKEQIFSNSLTPLIETEYTYLDKDSWYFNGAKILPKYLGPGPCETGPLLNAPWYNFSKWQLYLYPIYSHAYFLHDKKTTKFFNGDNIVMTEEYTYNIKGQLIKTSTIDSKMKTHSIDYLYPVDNTSDPLSASLIAKNLYDNLQETKVSLDGTELSKIKINYRIENSEVVQSEIVRSNGGSPAYTDVTFDRYGMNKTLKQFTQKGPPTCILWSYHNSRPIAVVKNINSATLESLLGLVAIDNFAARSNPSKADIDAFLAPLSNYFVMRYVYDPLSGLTSQTDIKGQTSYYEYDDFQQLKWIKDHNGNILKSFEYNYAPQL
jgi:hypothetical protein